MDALRAANYFTFSNCVMPFSPIAANIREGFARKSRPARDHLLNIADGETEEAIGHMRANFRVDRIGPADYWPIRNLLVVIAIMLTRLLRR